MKVSNLIIKEAVNESIEDYFNNINQQSGLKSWAETDAENGISSEDGKRMRMQPSNASRANYIPSNDFKLHTYQDWLQNYKPKGISYREYMNIKL